MSNHDELTNKRFFPRSYLSLPVCIQKLSGDQLHTTCLNMSEGGIFVIDEHPPQSGEICSIKFPIELHGNTMFKGDLEVLWIKQEKAAQSAGFGAKFIHIDIKTQEGNRSLLNIILHRAHLPSLVNKAKNNDLLAEDLTEIQTINLRTKLNNFINEYNNVGKRASFLWKWIYQGLKVTSLNTVDQSLWEEVIETKWLGAMFLVLLDDVVDEKQNSELIQQLLFIPYEPELVDISAIADQDYNYLLFTKRVWSEIEKKTKSLPRYSEFKHLLEFDYRQLLNCVRYELLVIKKQHLNIVEHDLYHPHSMHMMVSATIDLMASPDFDISEIGLLREVIWHGQMMGRIGNDITTWQRELKSGDFTSSIFALALSRGILTLQDILNKDVDKTEEYLLKSGLEDELLLRWAESYKQITELMPLIKSVDVSKFIAGLKSLLQMELGSRGLK